MATQEMDHSLYEYKGVLLDEDYTPKQRILELETYEDIRDDDVIIWTYPKAGTHWAVDIACKVVNDGDIEKAMVNAQENNCFEISVTVPEKLRAEMLSKNLKPPRNLQGLSSLPSPRVIFTHLQYHLLPPRLQRGTGKIIYVYRDPRDVSVSLFHHTNRMAATLQLPKKQQTWNDFYENYLNGRVGYGSWWDHFKSLEENLRKSNVLVLHYEEMKQNLQEAVRKISVFLGKTFADDTIQKIAESCTFESVKAASPHSPFLRKGVTGDWKNEFTVAQSEAFDTKLNRLSAEFASPYYPYKEGSPFSDPVFGTVFNYHGVIFLDKVVPLMRLQKVLGYNDIREDDVLVWTFPKSGTHWTFDIVNKILTPGNLEKINLSEADGHALEIVPPPHVLQGEVIPVHVRKLADESLDNLSALASPRVIGTHLQYHMLPKLLQEGKAKIIYVYRDPRDIAVSMLHMFKKVWSDISWPAFFGRFINGTTPFGSWYEHFKSCQDVAGKPHILVLHYEDMKKDLTGSIRKIAKFLGKSLDDDVVESISASCTIEASQKANPNSFFIRKGISGDWKNAFTVAQSELFDEKLQAIKESLQLDIPY